MKRTLPLLIVALVTFALVWLFMQVFSHDDNNEIPVRSGSPFRSSGKEPLDVFVRDPKSHKGVVSRTKKIAASEVKAGFGRLVVKATLPDGSTPLELNVRANPPLPEFEGAEGGRKLTDVPAGNYVLTVYGGDLIPVIHRGVEVKAGEERRLTLKMRRGVRPKGFVLDAETRKPIAGAEVNFNGYARATTAGDGSFRIDRALPKTCLDIITVANDDYGQIPFKGLVIGDAGNMKLYLGGGRGVVHCEIVNGTGIDMPKDAIFKVTRPPLFELRREMPLNGRYNFSMRKLYAGEARFEIHFPSGEFPAQRKMVSIPQYVPEDPPDDINLRFTLVPGATLQGKFKAPKNFTSGMVIQLRDRRNHVVAESKVDREGNYRFNNLPEQEFVPVVMSGSAPIQLPLITIAGDGVINKDVDILRRKWAK